MVSCSSRSDNYLIMFACHSAYFYGAAGFALRASAQRTARRNIFILYSHHVFFFVTFDFQRCFVRHFPSRLSPPSNKKRLSAFSVAWWSSDNLKRILKINHHRIRIISHLFLVSILSNYLYQYYLPKLIALKNCT